MPTKLEEELLNGLDEKTLRLLFPLRFHERTRITLMYPPLEGKETERESEHTAHAESFEVTTDARDVTDEPRHQATYTLDQIEPLFQLFALVRSDPDRSIDVRIDGHRLPLAMELWLPLLWAMRF